MGLTHEELLARWPQRADGQPESPAFLANLQDVGGIADMSVALLESFGIPVLKKYREGGGAGRIVLGFSGYGADLYVPASRLEEAKALLEPSSSSEH